jgi:predicted nucleic acid-binding protein
MKTLFTDTNILLSFYHLSSDDLEELRKLIVLIDNKQIVLVLTDQVKDEFFRNRGAKDRQMR